MKNRLTKILHEYREVDNLPENSDKLFHLLDLKNRLDKILLGNTSSGKVNKKVKQKELS